MFFFIVLAPVHPKVGGANTALDDFPTHSSFCIACLRDTDSELFRKYL